MRNYGEFVVNKKQAGADGIQVDHVTDPSLRAITNLRYRGFDLDYPDVERARCFLSDLKQFEASGTMPRLMIVRLGNDHTNGTTAGKLLPAASFADNDYALGMIVEGVSKSRFWAKTAIFAMEDDAQNGTGSRGLAPLRDAGDFAVYATAEPWTAACTTNLPSCAPWN